MAAAGGSSASATQYDVFLSFRGPDTRNTFTDCLYRTMVGQGIVAYRDSEELHAGDRIDDLLRAVGNSKICIPVLSRGYASSAWCLRELARVTELNESTGKPEILPIFFDVTPTDVKLRTELYLKDLEKHEQRRGAEMRRRWEAALGKVAEMKGWEVQGKAHGEVIDLMVKEVLLKLKLKQRPLDSKFIKVDKQVKDIMELLDVDSGTGVRFVGIYGMGGIGKTTLATCIFNELCPRFDGKCSFIGNIREASNRYGLANLQKQLATDIFDSRFVDKFIDIDEAIDSIRRRAVSKKVLIVLDDLDKKEQLKKLVGGPDTFGSGSRIIITTRDKRILSEEKGILAYEVKEMDPGKALELFSLHAFNSVSPPSTHQSLSQEVVSTTGGLPLALEVIGSYLCCQSEEIWKEKLKKLKNVPHDEVWDKLKISYDELRDVEKEIFLDIACFFINEDKSWAIYFWDACDLFPHNSLKKLTELCLIKIGCGDTIWMHDQLKDLGRDIVRQECTRNSIGRSRLWNGVEALKVVRSKERKDKVQALNLVGCYFDPISIVDEELEKMPNLKFLKLRAGTFVGDVNDYLLELRYLCWCVPPPHCKMANLHLKNLVVCKLSGIENTENWVGWNILKKANKLKVLSLLRCGGLKRAPDFSGCVNLERLSLHGCPNLEKVDSSIGKLKRLTHLDIFWCKSLLTLHEEIGGLVNLQQFCMKECNNVEIFPYSIENLASLSKLDVSSSKITSLPNSIGNAKHLLFLDLSGTPIVEFPISIGELTQLEYLSLHGCGNLRKLPESIGDLISLQDLQLSRTNIVELPNSIGNAKHLSFLDLSGTPIVELPISIGELTQLKFLLLNKCENLRKVPESIGNLRLLQKLQLSWTKIIELPDSIGNAKHLLDLSLLGTPIVELPISIGELTQLEFLSLNGCRRLRKLPESIGRLRSLQMLEFSMTEIVELPDSIKNLKQLRVLRINGMLRITGTSIRSLLAHIGMLERLEELNVHGCEQLVSELNIIIGKLSSLIILNLSNTRVRAVPTTINSLMLLQTLNLTECNELQELPKLPSSLKFLYVQSTSLRLVPDLSNLTNLVELLLSNGSRQALAQASNPMQTLQLQWVGKLSKPEYLNWGFFDVPVPLTELGYQYQLNKLTCSCLDSFNSIVVGPQFFNLKWLCKLYLYRSPLREILLDELEQLRDFAVRDCNFLERLSIISSSLRILQKIEVFHCPKLLETRFLDTMESLEELHVTSCNSLGGFCGLSNLKKLSALRISKCNGLRGVEGPEELELFHHLNFDTGRSLERLNNVSDLRIPNECRIYVWACAKLPDTNGDFISYGDYKEMILDRTRKTFNEKDEMDKDSEGSVKENDRIDCPVLEDSTKEMDRIDCSDSTDSTKKNDHIDCSDSEASTKKKDSFDRSICKLERFFTCKPFRFLK